MVVKIFSFKDALKIYEDVRLIRIKSKGSNLLIMEDYIPIIGEVNGDISFVDSNKERVLKGISGYYIHRKNTFELLVKENAD